MKEVVSTSADVVTMRNLVDQKSRKGGSQKWFGHAAASKVDTEQRKQDKHKNRYNMAAANKKQQEWNNDKLQWLKKKQQSSTERENAKGTSVEWKKAVEKCKKYFGIENGKKTNTTLHCRVR